MKISNIWIPSEILQFKIYLNLQHKLLDNKIPSTLLASVFVTTFYAADVSWLKQVFVM